MCPSEVLMFGEREEGLRDVFWVFFFFFGGRQEQSILNVICIQTSDKHLRNSRFTLIRNHKCCENIC